MKKRIILSGPQKEVTEAFNKAIQAFGEFSNAKIDVDIRINASGGDAPIRPYFKLNTELIKK